MKKHINICVLLIVFISTIGIASAIPANDNGTSRRT